MAQIVVGWYRRVQSKQIIPVLAEAMGPEVCDWNPQ